MTGDKPRILIEGGPFYKRVLFGLAFLLGAVAGVIVAIVILFSFNHHLLNRVCNGDKSLANIEHKLIEGQQQQTQGLLRSGITFGIDKKRLPELVAQGNAITDEFLVELDHLAKINCH